MLKSTAHREAEDLKLRIHLDAKVVIILVHGIGEDGCVDGDPIWYLAHQNVLCQSEWVCG